MSATTWIALASAAIAGLALVVSVHAAVAAHSQRKRHAAAAGTAELYTALCALRDASFSYGKPLGGEQPVALVAMHSAIKDLSDLRPAVNDPCLAQIIDLILRSPAVGAAMSIDPERFMAAAFTDELLSEFVSCSRDAHSAILRCQALRNGVT